MQRCTLAWTCFLFQSNVTFYCIVEARGEKKIKEAIFARVLKNNEKKIRIKKWKNQSSSRIFRKKAIEKEKIEIEGNFEKLFITRKFFV